MKPPVKPLLAAVVRAMVVLGLAGCGAAPPVGAPGPTDVPSVLEPPFRPAASEIAPTAPASEPIATSPATQPDSEAVATIAPPVPIVTASDQGVHLHSGGQTRQISSRPAGIAYAIGPDLVAFQAVQKHQEVYPPRPEGVLVWASGKVSELAKGAGVTSVHLLDARMLEGRPVALVAERIDAAGPDDTFEELVIVDLRDGSRTTVLRRNGWETGHSAARLLRNGDVIGLVSSEAQLHLIRWSASELKSQWTAEIGHDTQRSLTMRGGEVLLVESAFDRKRRYAPVPNITSYDVTTGEAGATRDHPLADPGQEIDTGLFCSDWLGASEVVCGRGSGPPVLIDTSDDTFRLLDAPTGALATLVRSP